MKNLRLYSILLVAALILSIPFFAMQLNIKGVNWGSEDFIIMGFLLFATGFAIEFTLRKFKTTKSRIIICGIIMAGLFLVWAELAVGIFGSPFAGS